ncbi:MAG: signal peptidase I [Gammaproteobacteria bacterium SHHR-1]|uniref:signal peptidase I n=1 Tax=Magnetovirga frankeli TaxID=947516 RepID=UPI00129381C7|nr:signal peptidase I [gamma proteobacterium SS-5]
MHFDFPTILVALTLGSGLIWLLDVLLWRPKRRASAPEVKEPWLVDISRSFFPVFLVVVLLRSFVVEPFRIPSGSMMPTLLIGDFILVNKFAYGLRLPVLETKILDLGEPQRGDVAVFRFPENPRMDYIKRVVALPGDRVDYRHKTILVNGQIYRQQPTGPYQGVGAGERFSGYLTGLEQIGEAQHPFMVHPMAPDLVPGCQVLQEGPVEVPAGHYFVMGDNRDNSNDSRCWGFVPESHLRGRAMVIWMNWDSQRSGIIDWGRIGQMID